MLVHLQFWLLSNSHPSFIPTFSSSQSFAKLCIGFGPDKPIHSSPRPHPASSVLTLRLLRPPPPRRYLRARRFIPKDAFGQFRDTEEWRKENHVNDLYEKIDVSEFEATRRLYPQWTGRRDKRGIPVYVFEVAHLNSKTISSYEESIAKYPPPVQYNTSKISPRLVRLFALYENLTRFVMPLCSVVRDRSHPETPISQSNNIVDISGVGLKQFWNLKSHMQDASTLATAHYPETLDRIFIIGAPSFFPTVWGWIKRWFDPITVSKIFILSSSNMKSTLEAYIDPANIPKKYGGELNFEFGMMPVPEPSIEQTLIWENPAVQNGQKTLPHGPICWVEEEGEVKAIAVGTENGKRRNLTVARLSKGISLRASQNPKPILNTPINESELSYLDTGVSTQPAENPDDTDDHHPPPSSSGTNTPTLTTNPTSTVSTPKKETKDAPTDGTNALASASLKGNTQGEKQLEKAEATLPTLAPTTASLS